MWKWEPIRVIGMRVNPKFCFVWLSNVILPSHRLEGETSYPWLTLGLHCLDTYTLFILQEKNALGRVLEIMTDAKFQPSEGCQPCPSGLVWMPDWEAR